MCRARPRGTRAESAGDGGGMRRPAKSNRSRTQSLGFAGASIAIRALNVRRAARRNGGARMKTTRLAAAMLAVALCQAFAATANGKTRPPNILFIIMDDVGIDQMQ